jgi:hypothetical protein
VKIVQACVGPVGATQQRLCVCGSPAWQVLGSWPGRAEIMQACAGLKVTGLWSGDHEAFHKLGVQSADVSVLPDALPQPGLSPASQQTPWISELMRSAAVS